MTLPKSRELVSLPLFQKLFGLLRNKPWLETRAAAVEELHAICSNDRDLELVVDLLEQFTFLSGNDFESRCAKIAQKITQDWKLSASDTVLVGKHFESGRGDSSGVINAMMQPALARTGENWSRRNFEISAKKSLQNSEFKNIVLVDDFSGSGESAANFLKWAEDLIAREKLGKKNIYLAFFCAMEKTKERIPIDNRICAENLDLMLTSIAEQNNLVYTRYADDITFSGNFISLTFMKIAQRAIEASKYELNDKKTLLARNGGKNIVTGISVSRKKLCVPRNFKRTARSAAHFLLCNGVVSESRRSGLFDPLHVDRVLGRLAYWHQVEPDNTFPPEARKAILQKLDDLKREITPPSTP
jgi:hypothetical protein